MAFGEATATGGRSALPRTSPPTPHNPTRWGKSTFSEPGSCKISAAFLPLGSVPRGAEHLAGPVGV